MPTSQNYQIRNQYIYPEKSITTSIGDFLSMPLRAVFGGHTINFHENSETRILSPYVSMFVSVIGSTTTLFRTSPSFNNRKFIQSAPHLRRLFNGISLTTFAITVVGILGLALKLCTNEKEAVLRYLNKPKKTEDAPTVQKPSSPLANLSDGMNDEEILKTVFGEYERPDSISLNDLNKYVTYRSLSDERRKLARKCLYDALFPLVNESETHKLPMSGHHSEEISIYKDKEWMIIEGTKEVDNLYWKIFIRADGHTDFKLFDMPAGLMPVIQVINENLDVYTLGSQFAIDASNKKTWLRDNRGCLRSPLEYYLLIGPNFIELLTFRLQGVCAFLSKNRQAFVFEQSLKLFADFRSGQLFEKSDSDIQTRKIGPLISPIIEHNYIHTWEFSKKISTNTFSIKFETKHLYETFRNHRSILLNHSVPDEMELIILTECTTGLYESKYLLQMQNEQAIIIPKGHKVGDEEAIEQNDKRKTQEIRIIIDTLITALDTFKCPFTMIVKEVSDKKYECFNVDHEKLPRGLLERRRDLSKETKNHFILHQILSGRKIDPKYTETH